MKYCKKCLQPDTRPGIRFDREGVCPPCRYAESLEQVDWDERKNILREITNWGKQHSQSGYDCIIGVSGGKDSTRQAIYVKEELGLKPLLVCMMYSPEQSTDRGMYNVSNMIRHGFDTVTISPGPKVWRALARHAFLKYGNWARATELALFSSVPRLAIAYQIPLILWGENPALTLGELSNDSMGWDGNQMKNGNTLGGGDITWLLEAGLKEHQILQYSYPSNEDMAAANLRIVYLGYFWQKWSKLDNGSFSALHGIDIRSMHPSKSGDLFGVDALDDDWVIMNQFVKYLKFGFAKVTETVNEEIRFGRMAREDAIGLVERYDGKCHKENIESFCRFIDIAEEDFWKHLESFVNYNIFVKVDNHQWKLKRPVGTDHE